MPVTADGYAMVGDDGIEVRSVSTTRMAAMINALVVNKGIVITQGTPPELIEFLYFQNLKPGERICKALIQVAEN